MKPRITIHSFRNGAAIFEWDGDVTAKQIDVFREMWTEAWETPRKKRQRPVFMFGGTETVVVVHSNPLGEEMNLDDLAEALHRVREAGGPWTPCGGEYGHIDCECYSMVSHLMGELG